MSGSRAVWKEVLAVYSVKTNTDQDNPQEVATMDDGKKQLLKDIFWEMNQISSRTESKTETVITETDDGHGNIVETESTVTQTYLYITVSHKTAEEMAAQYGFNEEQKGYLAELLADENNYLWSQVLYGITGGDGQIVTVALSLVGNVGGQPYWSWYGFNSRVEWCACFVSWCANECGYIDAGVIPKYAGCVNGVQWFKDRGQWLDGSAEPAPGMIIFFDWADESGQMDYPTIRVLFKRSKTARFIRSRATPATVAESMSILSVITRFLATAHLPIKIHKPPAFCRRLDYISERYCAGLKTKSLKIQT